MRAFILDRYRSTDALRAGDMPEPEVREDDVLVQVHAAGVNLLDSKIRNGEFKLNLPYRRRSSWATMWPGSCSGSDLACSDSSPAMKSIRGRMTVELALSPSPFRSERTRWRTSRRTSPWKRRHPSLWLA